MLSNIRKSLLMLLAATGVGFLFRYFELSEANIIMVYILAVLIIAMITTHQIYSLVSSFISVIVFNFFFTEPRYTLTAYKKDYPITFIIMFIAAFLTGSLAVRLKNQAKKSEEAALLAQKEQLRANLLRSISHDLRTPLTAISGNASNLLSNGEKFDAETKHQLYLDIYENALWLINIVENLLAVTKIEKGKMTLKCSTELMEEIVSEALQHVDKDKAQHNITVQFEEEFILAKIDAGLIIQVIVNIVDNAIKYTQKDSHIKISVGKKENKVLVTISDDGPGIPDGEKEHIFDMFYTGRNVADSKRSLGLGLFLCKSIIEAHECEIRVENHIPHGTEFQFTLPIGEVTLSE